MKVLFYPNGKMVIQPESGVEAFALEEWKKRNYVPTQETFEVKPAHYLAANLEIRTVIPTEFKMK